MASSGADSPTKQEQLGEGIKQEEKSQEERKEKKKEKEKEEVKEEEEGKEMKAWEQHAGVIKMPRFDYNAPSSLLLRSHSAFLITCSIKREKSATKEAITILDKCIGPPYTDGSVSEVEGSHENESCKRRKVLGCDVDGSCNEAKVADRDGEGCSDLSLVKLTRSGLVLLVFQKETSLDTVDVVSNIFRNLESGSLKVPAWCHRISPVQATCCLNEEDLRAVVTKLVNQFMTKYHNNNKKAVKFAISYSRRGLEESQTKIPSDGKDTDLCPLLDRIKCFDSVAAAVKDVVPDSSVDLKSPELSIFVELLPLSSIPAGSFVAAVSILPRNLVHVKPRLCVKALASEAGVKRGKS